MDDLCRTGCHAYTAAGTLLIVYSRMEILHLYRSVRTLLLTDLTADTAVLAVLLCDLAVVR